MSTPRPIDTLGHIHRSSPKAPPAAVAVGDQLRAGLAASFELWGCPTTDWSDETFDAVAVVLMAQSMIAKLVDFETAWVSMIDFVVEAAP
jgi:hypothetical protein